ncbi:hypothetical protein VTL71DRAFT_14892 [Oculimacula yallundae]|uniref:Uncharacterized protein n=1 Tax=Oculimacula yallundae TaxID=86028 RepID=A0ABR4CF31_9HELO
MEVDKPFHSSSNLVTMSPSPLQKSANPDLDPNPDSALARDTTLISDKPATADIPRTKSHRSTNSYDADSESEEPAALDISSLAKRLSLTSTGEEKERDPRPRRHKRRETQLIMPARASSADESLGEGEERHASDHKPVGDGVERKDFCNWNMDENRSVKVNIDSHEAAEKQVTDPQETIRSLSGTAVDFELGMHDSPSKKRIVSPGLVEDMYVKRPKIMEKGEKARKTDHGRWRG